MVFSLRRTVERVCKSVKGEIFPTHSTLYFTSIRDKLMENFSISKNIHVKFAFLGRKYYDRITWKLSAQSSKVERKFIFTSSWQCFHSIGLERFVMSSQSSLRFTHRHSSTGDANIMCWVSSDDMKDSSVWRGGCRRRNISESAT